MRRLGRTIGGRIREVLWEHCPEAAFAVSQSVRGFMTPAGYSGLLQHLKSLENLAFVPVARLQEERPDRRAVVAIRHDVDADIHAALLLGEAEASLGIPSSFYILHTAPYYRRRTPAGRIVRFAAARDRVRRLQDMGHEIGLHVDTLLDYLQFGVEPARTLTEELEFLRAGGILLTGVASHGSLHNYGAANYEIFARLSIGGRTGFEDRDGRFHRDVLGSLELAAFGLDYEANHIRSSRIISAEEYGHRIDGWFDCPWKQTDWMECAYTFRIGLWGQDAWTVNDFGREPRRRGFTAEPAEVMATFASLRPGDRVVLDVHPLYAANTAFSRAIHAVASRLRGQWGPVK